MPDGRADAAHIDVLEIVDRNDYMRHAAVYEMGGDDPVPQRNLDPKPQIFRLAHLQTNHFAFEPRTDHTRRRFKRKFF